MITITTPGINPYEGSVMLDEVTVTAQAPEETESQAQGVKIAGRLFSYKELAAYLVGLIVLILIIRSY